MRPAIARGSSSVLGLLVLGLIGSASNPSPSQALPYLLDFVPDVHGAARPSLKIDSSDQPRIAFGALDEAPQVLRFASKDGGTWTNELVDTLANSVDWPLPLILDGGSVPVIAYTRGFWDMRVAERTGPGAWDVETGVAHGGGRWAALASDGAGVRRVAYADGQFGSSASLRSAPDAWQFQDMLPDQGSIASEVQLVIGAANDARALYQFNSISQGQRLYYSELVAGHWTVEPVFPTAGDIGLSMAIAGDGASSFSYRYAGGIGLAHRDGPQNWSVESADAGGTGPTSLVYDATGRAHVAYLKGGAIWQAIRNPDGWFTEQVTTPDAGVTDGAPSLALDSSGDAWIAFVRRTPLEGGGADLALGLVHDAAVAAVDPRGGRVANVAIESVAPQPTSGEGRIAFRLAQPTTVTLELASVTGRIVARSPLGRLAAGPQVARWSPAGVGAGVYFLRVLGEDGASKARRWVLLP